MLDFSKRPVFGKGGGSSHAQQVSTHCRRARAFITGLAPGATLTLTPTPYPGTMLRERFTWLPSGWTTFFFQSHQRFSDLWILCPRGEPADLLASDWSLRSINFGDECIHSSRASKAKGKRARCMSRPGPQYQMPVDILLSLSHEKDANVAYDLGCDL